MPALDDLQAALDARPGAAAHWADFAPSYQRNLLRWVKLAKTPKTRDKRVVRVADAARDQERMKHF